MEFFISFQVMLTISQLYDSLLIFKSLKIFDAVTTASSYIFLLQ